MKDIYSDIDYLYMKNSNKDENTKIIIIIKAVFLKYLIDNNYIKKFKLNEIDFSFNSIISLWANKSVNIPIEDKYTLTDEEKTIIEKYIVNGNSLKGKNSHILGHIYEYISSRKSKKRKGMFYTPIEIIDHMLSLISIDFTKEFYLLDPACGSGFFLSRAYDKILENIYHGKTSVHVHKEILSTFWGFEKDPLATLISTLTLQLKNKTYLPFTQIFTLDSLLDKLPNKIPKFTLVIGNPPYIGHKNLDRKMFTALKEKYKEVFYDKADISYCFFWQGLSLLKKGGDLIYITSRYFLEALYGRGLREFIQEGCKIEEIIDYNGNRPIKGAEVDLAIVHLKKIKEKNPSIKVTKLSLSNEYKDYNTALEKGSNTFYYNQGDLTPEGWVLIPDDDRKIVEKIESKCKISLSDVCTAHQGVITGCDKAFVIDEKSKDKFNDKYLVPWIKNKNIYPFEINPSGNYLLYTDDILLTENMYEYQHLKPYYDRLMKRRECKKGIRKWYMLQWGRERKVFENRKIVFPYKAEENRFAIDENGSFFSADIYSLTLKDNIFTTNINLEYLTCLLNSSLYEFYFKTFAKKLGLKLYEYYPNTLMRLKIPFPYDNTLSDFNAYYDKIIQWKSLGSKLKVNNLLEQIDIHLFDFFGLNAKERKIVKNRL